MKTNHDHDQQFHDNLLAAAGHMSVPTGPTPELREACTSLLRGTVVRAKETAWRRIRRVALVPSLAAAAVLALAVSVFFPPSGTKPVDAAMVLAKLDQQITQGNLLEIKFSRLEVKDEASIDGWLTLSESAVAGDLQVSAKDGDSGESVELDFALGFSDSAQWLLLRRLSIPDSDAQAVINFFLPAGVETLITLPIDDKGGGKLAEHYRGSGISDLAKLNMRSVVEAIQTLVRNRPELGATSAERSDGTIEIRVPLGNAEVMQGLLEAVKPALKEAAGALHATIELDADDEAEVEDGLSNAADDAGLSGSTLVLVYDPVSQRVQSLSLVDLGPAKGAFSLSLRDGQIDPALLDAQRVSKATTRKLDLQALKSVFEGFQKKNTRDE